MTARPYFVLAANEGSHIASNPWGVAFGDYDRATVDSEREDMRDSGWKASALRVLKVCASNGRKVSQADIDSAISALNSKESK